MQQNPVNSSKRYDALSPRSIPRPVKTTYL
jgi:hypothetical protein